MTSSPGTREARVGPFAALGHSDFVAWLTSRGLSSMAAQVQSVGVGWAVYQTTHQPLDLGLVGLAQFVPTIALSLVAGHAADRFPRRRLLIACQSVLVVCAAALLLLARSGLRSPWPVYAVLVVVGSARAFVGPASQAIMPDLVPTSHFANAVSWSSTVWHLASVVGPIVGGVLSQTFVPAGAPFVASGTMHLLGVLLVLRITPMSARGSDPVSLAALFAGVRYVLSRPLILGAISLDLFAVLLGGSIALLPVYAEEILHVGPWGYGALRAAPGVGAIVMALVLALRPLRRKAGVTMLACVGIFGLATLVFGLSGRFDVSLAALVVLGAADMVSIFVRKTLVQLATPAAMRGRVSAVSLVFIGASNELGELESGLTAAWLGTVRAVVVGGIGTMVVVGLWTVLFPQLRRVERPDEVVPDDASPE